MGLPTRYHALMRFEVTAGPYQGQVGTIVEIDFETEWIGLRVGDGPRDIIRPWLSHVRLVERDDYRICTQAHEGSDQ